jgi:hypothetical protein
VWWCYTLQLGVAYRGGAGRLAELVRGGRHNRVGTVLLNLVGPTEGNVAMVQEVRVSGCLHQVSLYNKHKTCAADQQGQVACIRRNRIESVVEYMPYCVCYSSKCYNVPFCCCNSS